MRGWDEAIADGGEDRNETLQAARRTEALHHSLPFSQRHVGVLRPVIQPFVRPMFDVGHELTPGSSVRTQFVGDHALGRHALFFQQSFEQSPRCLGIAAALDNFIEDISVLINSTP